LIPFDSNGVFRPIEDGVRRLAIRGAGITVLSGGVGQAIQIIATVMLARLLSPSDFGLVAMVTTFSLLLANFGLNGFTEAVVQAENLDNTVASSLFWCSIGCGIVLTIAFAACGSLLARFYHQPHVAGICVVLSLTIFITSTSVLHLALLKRVMHFTTVSTNDVLSRAGMVATSILLAFFGWGYWALVGGLIVQPLIITIAAWAQCRWIPSMPRRSPGLGAMLRFSAHVYARFSFNYFARNMDNLLVGWRFNAVALGYYKKAYDLFALSASQLVSPLTVVAVAGLSRVNNDRVQYKKYFLNVLEIMAFIGMGLGAILTLTGKDIIRLLLGPGWEPAGKIFTYFGPGIGMMMLYGTHGWIHLSIGKADRWFRWGIVEFLVTLLLFLTALPWGPVGMAFAWTTSFWILTPPAFWYAGQPIGLRASQAVSVVWKYIFSSIVAGWTAWRFASWLPAIQKSAGSLGAAQRIAMYSVAFILAYCLAVVLSHRSFAPIKNILKLLKEMLNRRSGSASTPLLSSPNNAATTPLDAPPNR
jgi:O-antigen/teichoic acid export membrane protein